MKRIGLFFGTFDPIHMGHVHIAESAYTQANFHELWFIVTPHSPFKQEKTSFLTAEERVALVQKVCDQYSYMRTCDVELHLPSPQYTYHTLRVLRKQYPELTYALIMGSDTLHRLSNWKKASWIMKNYVCYVYDRGKDSLEVPKNIRLHKISGPSLDISATKIRACLQSKHEIVKYVPKVVQTYLYNK